MTAADEQRAVTRARSLDERQRAILRALYDYKILATDQLRVLFFGSARRCQAVMQSLAGMGLAEVDHPAQPVGVGRAQSLWTLTEQGVQVVAITRRKPRSQLDWMPRLAWHRDDRLLEHQLGVNRFFVSLVEASLRFEGHGLCRWLPEKYVRTKGGWIKHDGFGRYVHSSGACEFYYEHDRGTERKGQLVSKLHGYVAVATSWTEEGSVWFPNLLVQVPKQSRESIFLGALADCITDGFDISDAQAVSLPFFITSEELILERGVLGRIWRRFTPAPSNRPLAERFLSERLSIVELPFKDKSNFEVSECLGRYWTDEVSVARRRRRRTGPPVYPIGEPPGSGEAS